ncbi:MAG: response regulator [Desulfobacterales bacterium]|nr:response regulator [Desulfobacterales bacterium]
MILKLIIILVFVILFLYILILNNRNKKVIDKYTFTINEKEKIFTSLINIISDFIIVKDGEGRWLYTNSFTQKLFSIENIDFNGKNNIEFMKVAPLIYNDSLLYSSLTDEQAWSRETLCRFEEKIPSKDNKVFIYDILKSPLFHEDGSRNVIIIWGRDITSLKQVEQELNTAKEKAQESVITKNHFLGNISHEVRTPMNAIIGLTDLCLKTDLSEKQKDYLTKISISSKTLLNLITEMLDFSKIGAGNLHLDITDFNLNVVFSQVNNMLFDRAAEKGLELTIVFPEYIPSILKGDPIRLAQVLINLTSNSIKFTEKGEISISVDIEEVAKDYVILKFIVKDTGIGIPKNRIKTLFDSFIQGDSSITRKYGGTGLGLSICKELVTMMNGKIWVESTEEKGSSFYFTVKLGIMPKKTKWEFILPDNMQDRKVLVVDDSSTARILIVRYLELFGLKVETVTNGQDALSLIKQKYEENECFNLILTDLRMPGIDGFELSKILKSDDLYKHIPIIMMTAFSREEGIKEAKDIGIDAFLNKPVEKIMLFNTILNILSTEQKLCQEMVTSDDFGADNLKGSKVLIVEDNSINLQVACEILQHEGILVGTSTNGKEAILSLEKLKYDAVLMDVQMPEMDGFEATAVIRKDIRFKNLPIIAMTAHALKGDKERCLLAGMSDYVSKPIDPEEVINILRKWIKNSNSSEVQNVDKNKNDIDIPKITNYIYELYDLLKKQDFSAGEYLESIKKDFDCLNVRKEIRQMEDRIAIFEYDKAKEILYKIADLVGVKLNS